MLVGAAPRPVAPAAPLRRAVLFYHEGWCWCTCLGRGCYTCLSDFGLVDFGDGFDNSFEELAYGSAFWVPSGF